MQGSWIPMLLYRHKPKDQRHQEHVAKIYDTQIPEPKPGSASIAYF
jgi:hypothetical protein